MRRGLDGPAFACMAHKPNALVSRMEKNNVGNYANARSNFWRMTRETGSHINNWLYPAGNEPGLGTVGTSLGAFGLRTEGPWREGNVGIRPREILLN